MATVFAGAILLYVTPSRHVPLTLLNASAEAVAANIERLILETNLTEKAVYLPPKNLKKIESGLVFIPETPKTPLPTPEESNDFFSQTKERVYSWRPQDWLSHTSLRKNWAFHSQK